PNVCRENRQTKAVPQEQDAALVDMPVGQHKNVCRLEIDLGLVIWNEVRPEQHSSPENVLAERLLEFAPVFFASVRSAGDDQPIILTPSQDLTERSDEVVE